MKNHKQLKEEIKDYLVSKYEPKVVILHGSRASENYRPHSDWDIFLFVEESIPERKVGLEVFCEHALDVSIVEFPNVRGWVTKKLVAVSHSIEVLYDTDGVGGRLVQEALTTRAKGWDISKEHKFRLCYGVFKGFRRLKDSYQDEGLFFHRMCVNHFSQVVNCWFRIIRGEYSLPPYLALPMIKSQDPEYYELLEILWSNKPNTDKLTAAQKINDLIYAAAGIEDFKA